MPIQVASEVQTNGVCCFNGCFKSSLKVRTECVLLGLHSGVND